MKNNIRKNLSVTLAVIFCMSFVFDGAVYAKSRTYEPRVVESASFKVVFLEFLGGLAGPFVTMFDLLGSQHANCCNCGEYIERGYLALPIILFPLSLPYGVYVVWRKHNQGGSYWAALAGSLVFMGSWAGATSQSDMDNVTIGLGYYFLDVLGAVIGYNLFKPKPTVSSFKGNLNLYCTAPRIYLSSTGRDTSAKVNFSILEARF